jgi:hypothetical protein
MSRSQRKIAKAGVGADSDKKCKVQANQNLRRENKALLKKFEGEKEMKMKKEVSDEWDFCKDGKMWFDGYPKRLRK